MKRMLVAIMLLVLGITGSIARAGVPRTTPGFALRAQTMIQNTPAPPEWAGVWTTVDSTYVPCELPFGSRSTGADTICAGKTFEQPSDPMFNVTCSGTADATTFHQHCTGTADLGGGCTGTVDITIDGTRSNDTFRTVSVVTFTPDTPGPECTAICIRLVSYGTRTGPAPSDYCTTTAARPSSWGRLKILYR
jgi:hypothetical protein